MPNETIKLTPRYKMAHDIYIGLLKLGFDEKTIQDFLNNINDADVAEVVRCKKCEHYNTSCCANGFGWCEKHNRGEMDDHFCNFGERRTNDA